MKIIVNDNHFLLKNFDQDILTEDHEFFIIENIQFNLSLTSMKKQLFIYINKNFDEEDENFLFIHDNYI